MNIVDRLKDSLDYEFNLTYSEYKQLLDYITNLQKENEELNKMCEIYSQSLYNADLKKAEQEVDRLNNIINELENKLLQLRLTDIDGRTIVYRMLDKLKELKDSDNNVKKINTNNN